MEHPTVSVIVVNFNGLRHLDACFRSLVQQDYPADKIELLLVDNGSSDGSLAFMEQHFPQVRLIRSERNLGFAPAVNLAAQQASGSYLALINNDAYAAPDWISALVRTAEARRDEGVACVSSRMLDWHGRKIDFVDGGINFHGFGAQLFMGMPADSISYRHQPLLFGCGGAMLVDREVFLQIGAFDEDFFAYFEDVDFGWRLWVCGYQVLFEPDAVVYHRHHSTASTMYAYQTRLLFERNALMMIMKNYDDEHLQQVLPVALLMLVKRAVMEAGAYAERGDFDLRKRDGATLYPLQELPKSVMSCLLAVDDVLNLLPRIYERRAQIKQLRRRPDSEILPLFKLPLAPNFMSYSYAVVLEKVVDQMGLRAMFEHMPASRILVMSSDPLRKNLAGTGIRAVEIARVLSQHCQVVLAAFEAAEVEIPGVQVVTFTYEQPELVEALVQSVDVVLVQGFLATSFPFLTTTQKIVVVDLYDPFPLSNLEFFRLRSQQDARTQHGIDMLGLRYLIGMGDFFLCASEKQRDFWLGALAAHRRLSPEAYQDDRSLRRLIDLAPFGISSEPPQQTEPVLKGVVEGIGQDDIVLLWGGGVWDWFDPLTLLEAMARVREQRSDVKLFFLGRGHPNTRDVPEMLMYDRTVALAAELDLTGKTVFFNERWVPYAERQNYLLESDIGVSTHPSTVETDFAFRTRLLDYIWAGLPMIVSRGDAIAEVVASQGLGAVVTPGDVHELTQAIVQLAAEHNRRECRAEDFARVREQFHWERTLEPLVRFCKAPYHAADALSRRPLGAPGHAQTEGNGLVNPALLRTTGELDRVAKERDQRLAELDRIVEEKNQHIAYLEGLLRQIESGKVMRALNTVNRVIRGRGSV